VPESDPPAQAPVHVSGPDPAAAASPEDDLAAGARADWQRRVAGRSSHTAAARAVDRGTSLIRAAATVLDRGLARLRLRLAEVRPDLVGRAHAAVASLVRELIDEAAAAGRVEVADPEAASYIVLSLNGAYITAETLGNDVGATRPDVEAITSFCLRGLRAELDDGWFDAVNARLRLPQRR
jgi:hypothetical protein